MLVKSLSSKTQNDRNKAWRSIETEYQRGALQAKLHHTRKYYSYIHYEHLKLTYSKIKPYYCYS